MINCYLTTRFYRTGLRGISLSVLVILTVIPMNLVGQSQDEAMDPKLKTALGFEPIQDSVDYTIPAPQDAAKCQLTSAETIGKKGWVVIGGDGQLLRAYLDNNGDGRPDQWSYYKNGIEVYRDIDSNFDEKADQYRWLGPGGTRWGWDQSQDGKIDEWKMLSAEELSMEVVEAIKAGDAARFRRLLLDVQQIKSLSASQSIEASLLERVESAAQGFSGFASQQTLIDRNTEWVHFGGIRPGVVPADLSGAESDIVIYDNVQAVVSNGDSHGQLSLGTLVQTDQGWRLTDLPETIEEGVAIASTNPFYSETATTAAESAVPADSEISKLFTQYAELDKQIQSARGSELARLHEQRASLLLKIADRASDDEERANWLRQLADDVSGAYQNGDFPGGLKWLDGVITQLERKRLKSEAAYAKYRRLAAYFTKRLSAADPDDYADIEEEYNNSLEEFVGDHPTATQAADALMQLAVSAEFSGEPDVAANWYGKITQNFPQSPLARKAQGARIRLTSEGKSIRFSGKTLRGDRWDLARQTGRVVLIQFWATWCEPCKQDLATIKRMHQKYGSKGLVVASASMDDNKDELVNFLRNEQLPWVQLFEEGGLEGPLAEQLGIATLPTMLLVGKDGKVIARNITAAELDREIQKAIRD